MGQVTELSVVGGTLDSTAFGMAQYHDKFRSGELGGELKAAYEVGIRKITGNTGTKDIPDSLVENNFRRNSLIDTTKNTCKRKLTVRSGLDLRQQLTF